MANQGTGYSMAAVGEYETVLPFQAVGIRPCIVKDSDLSVVEEVLRKLALERYVVVFIQENLYFGIAEGIDELNREYSTSFIPVPGLRGSTGMGLESIRSSVERAVGMDIFKEK